MRRTGAIDCSVERELPLLLQRFPMEQKHPRRPDTPRRLALFEDPGLGVEAVPPAVESDECDLAAELRHETFGISAMRLRQLAVAGQSCKKQHTGWSGRTASDG